MKIITFLIILILLALIPVSYLIGKWNNAYIAPESQKVYIYEQGDCPDCPPIGVVECPQGTIQALKERNLCEQANFLFQKTIEVQKAIIEKLK